MYAKMIKKIIPILLVTFLLSGCGLYNVYERPLDIQTDLLYGPHILPGDIANIGQQHWREIFTDRYLQSLIERGLQNNTDLNIARTRIDAAEALFTSSKLAFLPSITFNSQGNISAFDGGKPSDTYNVSLAASWQIDIFGKLRNASERAKATLEGSYAYKQAVQTRLIASIATSYYTLLSLDEQLKTMEETAEIWKENVRAMKAMMKIGQYNDAGVSQAEADYSNIQASILDIRQNIRETENALSILLGEPIHGIERGSIAGWKHIESLDVGLPLVLLSQRPDVMQAEYNLAAAFYTTNEARAAFYPTLTLGGSAGWTNNAGSYIVNPGKLLLEALGSLTQPIFENGRLVAQYEVSKAQQEEAKLLFQQTLLNAGMEVNNALTQVQTIRDKSGYYAERVAALQRTVKTTSLLMKHGSASYLEILTAQENLLTAQLDQLSNKYAEIISTVALYQALGGGHDSEI